MRRTWVAVGVLLAAAWVVAASHPAWGFPAFARQTKAACEACHANPAGGVELTAVGKAFKEDHKAAVPTDAKANEYVGSAKCRMCHSKQHKAWMATPHASAWKALAGADEKKVAEMAAKGKIEAKAPATESDACVTCHVTGFHLAGGFPAADSTKNAALENVTCEACHGPGSRHVAASMADKKKMINVPGEKLCRQCHTPEFSPKFNFEEFKKRVHPAEAAKTSG